LPLSHQTCTKHACVAVRVARPSRPYTWSASARVCATYSCTCVHARPGMHRHTSTGTCVTGNSAKAILSVHLRQTPSCLAFPSCACARRQPCSEVFNWLYDRPTKPSRWRPVCPVHTHHVLTTKTSPYIVPHPMLVCLSVSLSRHARVEVSVVLEESFPHECFRQHQLDFLVRPPGRRQALQIDHQLLPTHAPNEECERDRQTHARTHTHARPYEASAQGPTVRLRISNRLKHAPSAEWTPPHPRLSLSLSLSHTPPYP
jgi:hypothetical protein